MLNDDQRRRLAVTGKVLGRKALHEIATIVAPDAILRWHRQLVAKKWDYSNPRQYPVGRPRLREKIVRLIVRMAKENGGWGYDRIQGALKNVGFHISDSTIGSVLKHTDTEVLLLPPRSPNLNAYSERYMRTMKSECLNKMIFFGENSLRRALKEFTEHYHSERNHQGIGNELIESVDEVGRTGGDIQCNERLGGMLKYYYREAA